MSTIGYDSWAVDLANVAAVYPFQGWEVIMTVIGVIFWLGWHRVQFVRESAELDAAKRRALDKKRVQDSIERY